jgi:hypothetical protein
MAIRFDRGELQKPLKMANGWLRLDGYLTRTGIFEYLKPDGSKRLEFRPPDEVFKADSLATFSMVPVTDDHPPVMLDASNTTEWARGAVSESVRQDGDKLRAALLITDASLVEKMERKDACEVSCGYHCDMDETPGEHQGQRYDAVQRNIRGNHVAIVSKGRAGADVRVRMDGAAVEVDRTCEGEKTGANDLGTPRAAPGARGRDPMNKIRIDGVDFDPSTEAFAQAFAKYEAKLIAQAADAKKELEAATSRADKAEAKADAAVDEKAKLETEMKELPARIRTDMAARAELDAKARVVLGKEVKLDALTPADVRKMVLAKLAPDVKLDGRSEAYVEARFDAALEAHAKDDSEWHRDAEKLEAPSNEPEKRLDADEAKKAFVKASQAAWKKSLTSAKSA